MAAGTFKSSIICLILAGVSMFCGARQASADLAKKPHIVIIWGDDIGQSNISAYTNGLMGYRTPNIDSIAKEGVIFTDYYGEQSCTAGRASFITGQSGLRTGLTKVGYAWRRSRLAKRKIRRSRSFSRRRATRRASSAKITLATRTSSCRPRMASTSSTAISIILNAEEEPELPDYPKARRPGVSEFS